MFASLIIFDIILAMKIEDVKNKIIQLLKLIWYAGVSVEIDTPKPFAKVGNGFKIWGKVPKSWLESNRYGLGLNTFSIDSKRMTGQGVDLYPGVGLVGRLQRKITFSTMVGFSYVSRGFLEECHGRIVIEITGYKDQSYLLPVVIDGFDTGNVNQADLRKRHADALKKIYRCERGIKKYHIELGKLFDARQHIYDNAISQDNNSQGRLEVQDEEILEGVFGVLQESEDTERVALDNKYKEAIEWAGPMAHGVVGRRNGFQFTVYSNDHGQHFHVIHRGRGVDARFSFPQIQLINYKNLNSTIGSKEINDIRDFFNIPENFNKLEAELMRVGRAV